MITRSNLVVGTGCFAVGLIGGALIAGAIFVRQINGPPLRDVGTAGRQRSEDTTGSLPEIGEEVLLRIGNSTARESMKLSLSYHGKSRYLVTADDKSELAFRNDVGCTLRNSADGDGVIVSHPKFPGYLVLMRVRYFEGWTWRTTVVTASKDGGIVTDGPDDIAVAGLMGKLEKMAQ